jgi:hypothetical protein
MPNRYHQVLDHKFVDSWAKTDYLFMEFHHGRLLSLKILSFSRNRRFGFYIYLLCTFDSIKGQFRFIWSGYFSML